MQFDHKIAFDRHMNRKSKCNKKTNSKTKIYSSKTNKKLDHECMYCERIFSRKDSLKRHLLICKNKKNKIVSGVENKGNNNRITNKNINSHTYNFYNNHPIILISFGKDGAKCIDSKTFKKILGSNKNIIESMISSINLDPEKPQHHNIFYGDTKSSYGEIFENNTWIKKKID